MARKQPVVEKQQEWTDTPEGWCGRWAAELEASNKELARWHERGRKIVKRYLDERDGGQEGMTRLNLFTANTQTMQALLYGKTPQVSCQRTFGDSNDDVARVGAEMLERLLNNDIEKDSDTTQEAYRNALSDRLLPGLGNVRLRYTVRMQVVHPTPAIINAEGYEVAPAVPGGFEKAPDSENVAVDYVHWQDQRWSPCRTFAELRWWAFRAEMSKEAVAATFGDEVAARVSMQPKMLGLDNDSVGKDPLARCEVWEIWDRENRCVWWWTQGMPAVIAPKGTQTNPNGSVPDPLGLDGFWPFPRPMWANLTTSKLLPTPDFVIAQDLYDDIDNIAARLDLLESAVRVVGVYDKTSSGVQRLLTETTQNTMIPVENWAMFAEKGGVKGVVDWFPLEMVVEAIGVLSERLLAKISMLFQITGMSDIMRGQSTQQTTATEQAIKARFASVRVQTMQDEFARFASETQRLKAEIIAKHFDDETILRRSNIQQTPDAQLAPQAIALIKQPGQYRISVNPDAVSLTDFAALKQERFEFMQAMQGFLQAAFPMAQALPMAAPFMLEIIKWALSGLKGANTIEGVFDQMIAKLEEMAAQPPQPPPPDPKVEAAKVKAGAEEFKAKADVMKTGLDLKVAKEKHAMDMQKISATMQAEEGRQRTEALKSVNEVTSKS